ncbi:hypothetical protein XELAEV_18003688mg [Xenopus laevis]|nr:hypothetical protein XELAEV_18003688mg [Xenopus laevis]
MFHPSITGACPLPTPLDSSTYTDCTANSLHLHTHSMGTASLYTAAYSCTRDNMGLNKVLYRESRELYKRSGELQYNQGVIYIYI